MATTKTKKKVQRPKLTLATRKLLHDAVKALEGSDMEYYACHACNHRWSHAPECIVRRIYKRLGRP